MYRNCRSLIFGVLALICTQFLQIYNQPAYSKGKCFLGFCGNAADGAKGSQSKLGVSRLGVLVGSLRAYSTVRGCIVNTSRRFNIPLLYLNGSNLTEVSEAASEFDEILSDQANSVGFKHSSDWTVGLIETGDAIPKVNDRVRRKLFRHYLRQVKGISLRDHFKAGEQIGYTGLVLDSFHQMYSVPMSYQVPFGANPQQHFVIVQSLVDCVGGAFSQSWNTFTATLRTVGQGRLAKSVPIIQRWVVGPQRRPPTNYSMRSNFISDWEEAIQK